MTLVAGQPLTAATLNAEIAPDWKDFKPVWTATTTNPVLNNGTLRTRYVRTGNVVHFQGVLTPGSTTTFGSGEYRLSLPVTAVAGISWQSIGGGWVLDVSTGNAWNTTAFFAGSTTIVLRMGTGSGANGWSNSAPFTLAQSDIVSFYVTYEAA